MRVAFLTPPFIPPSEPGLSAAAAAAWFRAWGIEAEALDASVDWLQSALARPALEQRLQQTQALSERRTKALRASLRDATASVPPLRRPSTYGDPRRYSSAITHLEQALALATLDHPEYQVRIGDVGLHGRQPHASEDLAQAAAFPSPFDAYLESSLVPRLREGRFTHVAFSLTFLHQTFATFRWAHLLRQHLPELTLLLGGPLVACWKAVGADLRAAAFQDFHQVLPDTQDTTLEALAQSWGGHAPTDSILLTPDLAATRWDAYLVPQPTIPIALRRGCTWRRCAFCPDHLHPAPGPSPRKGLRTWLESVARRFPDGAMLHLTDSALSPAALNEVAQVIQEGALPLRWHGFVRMEGAFTQPAVLERLAAGGCTMLQWGLETASPRLLDLLDKGITPEGASQALRASAAAGIRNHAYLLFGLPTETEADRECTLAFVHAHANTFHDLNVSLLNLPRQSPMHRHPERYGITKLSAFGADTDLSLYLDFHCGASHPRLEARRWVGQVFQRDDTVKALIGGIRAPFKAHHSCFLPTSRTCSS